MILTLAFVSVNISNAFESSRNNSTALGLSGFLSGWQVKAFLRYALLIWKLIAYKFYIPSLLINTYKIKLLSINIPNIILII